MSVAAEPRECDICRRTRRLHQASGRWVCKPCYDRDPSGTITDEEIAQQSPAAEPEKPAEAKQKPEETPLQYVKRVLGLEWEILTVSRPMVHPDAAITIELETGD